MRNLFGIRIRGGSTVRVQPSASKTILDADVFNAQDSGSVTVVSEKLNSIATLNSVAFNAFGFVSVGLNSTTSVVYNSIGTAEANILSEKQYVVSLLLAPSTLGNAFAQITVETLPLIVYDINIYADCNIITEKTFVTFDLNTLFFSAEATHSFDVFSVQSNYNEAIGLVSAEATDNKIQNQVLLNELSSINADSVININNQYGLFILNDVFVYSNFVFNAQKLTAESNISDGIAIGETVIRDYEKNIVFDLQSEITNSTYQKSKIKDQENQGSETDIFFKSRTKIENIYQSTSTISNKILL